MAVALVELGLELDPVETKGVEEGGEGLHEENDTNGRADPGGDTDEGEDARDDGVAHGGAELEGLVEGLVPEDSREL